jgi:urease accessory protein UreH
VDSPRSALRVVDRRAASAIGREARLDLTFEVRHGRTTLAHAYAEPPFRIGRAFDLDGAAYVILVCSGPGIFGGDVLRQSVHVGRGARVVLTSQSALQVHPSSSPASFALPAPAAVLHHDYIVEDEAELHCHWDPVIPFASARLDQRFDIGIAGSSRLYWSDALMAGRVSRGEAWRFDSVAHELRLRVGGALAYLERYTLAPDDRAMRGTWTCGDAAYLATALVHHADATAEAAEALYRVAAGFSGVAAGVDLIEPRLVLARFLAATGAPFARARASYRTFASKTIFGRPELLARK